MNFPASPAEVFTIDFVPDDASASAVGGGNLSGSSLAGGYPSDLDSFDSGDWIGGSETGRSETGRSDSKNLHRSAYSIKNAAARNSIGRQASRGLDQFIGDQSNSLINWLWESLQNNQYHYWPLTIFGPSGVGKTKLTHRLAVTVLQQMLSLDGQRQTGHSRRVLTISAKDLFRSFRRSLEINSVAEWRARFESAPVLLLDDLHQLLDYADIQHELCEILDRRLSHHVPTILVSNISPLTMGLIPSLCSRLSGGFCCGLSAAGPDALLTIIQRLFAIHNTQITNSEAHGLIACGVSEIGLIQQIIWRWKLEKGSLPFQLDAASQTLRKLIGAASQNAVPPEKVLRATAKQFECLLKDLRGSSRKSTLVRARGVAIWICRSRLQLSFKAIGKILGNRDHTTIMNGMEKTCALLDSDSSVALATDRILQKLGLDKR